MKKLALAVILFLIAGALFGQDLRDLLARADAAYSRGAYGEAVSLLDMAAASYAADGESKAAIADAYNDVGQREYRLNNFLNAYDNFRKAVKIAPTNQAASQNFWKMKKNFKVDELRNEGGSRTMTADARTDGGTAGKLREAETMLETLKTSDSSTSTASGARDSAELKRYQEELEKQQALIKQLQDNYVKTMSSPTAVSAQESGKTQEILDNLVKLYEVALSSRGQPGDNTLLAEQMKEYRTLFQEQQSSSMNIMIIAVASSGGVILIVFALVLFVMLAARRRRRQRFANATNFDIGFGAPAAGPQELEDRTVKLLGYEPPRDSGAPKAPGEPGEAGTDVEDLVIRAERLKRMKNEKKYGTLKWETLRKYVTELEKDLRSDILYVVESRIENGEAADYSRVLPVLFPFLTDPDDYLRNKARRLVEESAARSPEGALDAEPAALLGSGAGDEKSDGPLSLAALMRHLDELKFTKTDRREHCLATAKYARGIALMHGSLSQADQELLYKTALVHDIGYVLMDKEKIIELESKKDLTEEEFSFIHQHPQKGVDYFKDRKLPKKMKEGILHHHERNDGSGYPKGLKADKIPAFAKIIGIADSFDALTRNRAFRDKMSFDSAAVIMRDLGRDKFDSEYLKAFFEYLKKTGKIR